MAQQILAEISQLKIPLFRKLVFTLKEHNKADEEITHKKY
jgi:hypothetical protein